MSYVRSALVGSVVTALVALAAACVPPPDPVVAINMGPGGHFFSMPWPSDTRRAPDGTLDLDGLPGVDPVPGEVVEWPRTLFPAIVDELEAALDGFGVSTATYFQARTDVKPWSLPSPSASLRDRSNVMLIDLDQPGERVPVIVDYQATPDRNRPGKMLTVLPYPGHPLRESTRYAAVVFDGIKVGADQKPLPAPLLRELDEPWTVASGFDEDDWNLLRAQRDEVRQVVDATTGWKANDVLAFAVFTTQDVDRDMRAVADAIHSSPAPQVQVTAQSPCAPDDDALGDPTSKILGTVELTRWQAGPYPYHHDGGEIVVGADDLAEPQGTFAAEFLLRMPCGEPPPTGWPLVAFITGTGGEPSSNLTFTHRGYAVASISPIYGVGRGITVTPEMQALGLTTEFEAQRLTMYNFLNPAAVRSNPIQQAAEFLELLEAFEHVELDGSSLGASGVVRTDPARQVVAGQSQGSQSLPMVAAMRTSLMGVLSAAGGGGLMRTVVHGTFNRLFLGALSGDADSLDELNPLIQLGQSLIDGGDGINYPSSMSYLQYHGRNDCQPEYGRYAAGAIGLPVVHWFEPEGTYGDDALEPPRTSLPVQGNVDGVTRVALERPGGHFVGYDQRVVNQGFLDDLAAGVAPTIRDEDLVFGPSSGNTCAVGERWDVPPTPFGRGPQSYGG